MIDPLAFLNGGGDAERLIRNRDWSSHPMGLPRHWPDHFKSILSLLLNSPESMILAWGPELHFFFNEAYFPLLGPRVSWAMGERFDHVWADAWEQAKPIIDEAMAGRSRRFIDLPWKLATDRGQADTWWTFSYSRILDSSGAIAGLFIVTNETTERVLADRKAAEAERQLLRAQQAGGVGLFAIDIATDEAITTPEFCRIYGMPMRERIPLSEFEVLVLPSDTEQASNRTQRVAGEMVQTARYRIRRPDTGEIRWITRRADVEYDPEGRAVSYAGVVRDVTADHLAETALREAERALQASEAELRQVANALPFLVALIDRSLTYLFANAAYKDWFDLAPEKVIGRTIIDVAGREGFELRRPAIERALAGETVELDLAWPWPDGRRRIANIHYTPRRRTSGEVDGFYVFVQDVTDLRDAAALLAERAASLSREVAERTEERDLMWETSPELMLVIGFDGVFRRVNPSWTRLLGYAPEELVGHHVNEFVLPEDHTETVAAYTDAAEGGLPRIVNRYRHKDGSVRWISWVAAPAGNMTYATGRDITQVKEQEDALRKAEEQLRQSQKMEAVGQLTGGIAHDFNNLLAGISGSLELMSTRIDQGRLKDVDRYMAAAQGAAKRAAALTHRLLAFSRRQTLTPKPTNVNVMVADMLELIRRSVGPGIEVEFVGMSGLWWTLVDTSQLENALLNLCINARDAMPDGGRITIETGNRWIDRHAAKQHDMPEGQYLSLCVTDTGTGMPPEVISKAFDPFFTTKPIGQGTGLGLSMIYGFTKQSGGQVRIYSEVGQGTMVCLYLPCYRGSAEQSEAQSETEPLPIAEAGETVLIVDDEPTVRMLVTDVLGDLGYTAVEAADGAGGLKVLNSDARIDLLITDVGLPGGMNGRQMADAARVKRPDLKVLFITGFAENALLSNGQLEPGMAVLTKPFAVDTLAARIRELIGT